jgi:hypothetical protein
MELTMDALNVLTPFELRQLRKFWAVWSLERLSRESGVSKTQLSQYFGVTLNCRESARDDVFLHAVERKFDSILVWRFDRFARSTKHLSSTGRCQRPRTDVARAVDRQ